MSSYFSLHYDWMDAPNAFPELVYSMSPGLYVQIVVSFIGSACNLMVLLCVLYQLYLGRSKLTDILAIVVSQSFTDGLYLLNLTIEYCIVLSNSGVNNKRQCLSMALIEHYSCAFSCLCLCIFAYERKCTIQQDAGKFSIRGLIAAAFFIAVFYATMPLYLAGVIELQPGHFACIADGTWNVFTVISISLLGIYFSVLAYFNYKIWDHTIGVLNAGKALFSNSRRNTVSANESKVTASLMMTVVAFFIGYTPYIVFAFTQLFDVGTRPWMVMFVTSSIMFTTTANAFIYRYSNPVVADMVKRTLGFNAENKIKPFRVSPISPRGSTSPCESTVRMSDGTNSIDLVTAVTPLATPQSVVSDGVTPIVIYEPEISAESTD